MNDLISHERVLDLKRRGKNDEATQVCLSMLDRDRNDAGALFQLAAMMTEQDSPGVAYHLLARAAKLAPDVPEIWMQYGKAHPDDPENWPKTEWCLRKAIKVAEKRNKPVPLAWAQLAMLKYIQGKYDEAEQHIAKAFAIDPEHENTLVAQSFVKLALGQWDQAWAAYDLLLKSHRREAYGYGDTEAWDGSPGKRVVVSGEQGIGDEILYCSIIPDLIRDSEQVIIDCMPRLEGLFRRSFPGAAVYGQRWKSEVVWEDDHAPNAHIAMASLPQHYRHKDADFPGMPYLKADTNMRRGFRAMLDALGDAPKIGIAWTGGTDRTRGPLRTRSLEELLPLLRQDAVWVSLEYRDRTEEIDEYEKRRGIKIHQFPWITRKGLDYDLTAALVAELDLVITVPSAVSQTSGALGTEAWVLVPKYRNWLFAREQFVWANSVTLLRDPLKDVGERLQQWIERKRDLPDIRAASG